MYMRTTEGSKKKGGDEKSADTSTASAKRRKLRQAEGFLVLVWYSQQVYRLWTGSVFVHARGRSKNPQSGFAPRGVCLVFQQETATRRSASSCNAWLNQLAPICSTDVNLVTLLSTSTSDLGRRSGRLTSKGLSASDYVQGQSRLSSKQT